MLNLNIIRSLEDYQKIEGFTAEEAPLALESDYLFNKWKLFPERFTEEEENRYYELVDILGL